MRVADLFEDAPERPATPERGSSGRSRRTRGSRAEDRHYRLAMKAARRIGRARRRDRAGRLICHHLRCMLETPPGASAP
jgi:RNase P protein component